MVPAFQACPCPLRAGTVIGPSPAGALAGLLPGTLAVPLAGLVSKTLAVPLAGLVSKTLAGLVSGPLAVP